MESREDYMLKKNKVLLFVPYQDEDNFYMDGILTREFAMLYSLFDYGYKEVVSIKKPRTFLDRKKYQIVDSNYPVGTVEYKVKSILDNSETVQYLPFISLAQIIKRRGWWELGYKKTIKLVEGYLDFDKNDYLVYSDNPFASELLKFLKDKGCKLYFDIMDNFAIHPSLNKNEKANALRQYKTIFEFADVISANSDQTCQFMKIHTLKKIFLVKNGVFSENEIVGDIDLPQIQQIRKAKENYKKCVGYIGKLGLRLDADLIEQVSRSIPDTLFVFVGGYLKGQINEKLLRLFEADNNVLHIDGIPSAYVYSALNEFDILSIPHSVGKSENGGDPLKLYQYLTRKKPIITTSILGVTEFKKYIKITNSLEEWIQFIQTPTLFKEFANVDDFTWSTRLKPVMKEI